MCLTLMAPKMFLWLYPLSLGANIFAILMICLKVLCIIVISIELVGFAKCESCTHAVLRSAYGFGGTAIIYCVIMICVHIWFLWAIKQNKSSVVLIWVVVTSMWLTQTLCLTVVFLCMFTADASFASWLLCAAFGFIAFCIAAYGVSVGFGLWLELKSLTPRNTNLSN